MTARCFLRFTAFAFALCVVSPSHAAEPDAHQREEARSRFDRAIRLFENGNYESALVEFRTSMVGYPTRVAAFNIAVCLRKLGRFDEEEDALAFVAEHYPATKRAQVEELRSARQQAADRIATLTLDVNEAGAAIFVDGRARGESPQGPLRVSAGVRFVTVRKTGFVPFELRLDLPARTERSVKVMLATEDERPARPEPIAGPVAKPPVVTSRLPIWPAFVLGGGGVAAVGVGAVFLGLRAGTVADGRDTCRPGLTDASVFGACQSLDQRARTQAIASGILIGTGAALVVGAGIYAVVRSSRSSQHARLACAPSLLGAVCTGSF
jgi:hypothetical protein